MLLYSNSNRSGLVLTFFSNRITVKFLQNQPFLKHDKNQEQAMEITADNCIITNETNTL